MQKICRQCDMEFQITKEDLGFYDKVSPVFNGKKYSIPPPTLCPDCRQQRRLTFRNERNLYHRKCDLSGKQIISIYSPDKPLKVYAQKEWWSDKWDALDYGRDFDFERPFFEQFNELLTVAPKMAQIQQGENQNAEYTNCASWNKNCYLIFSANQNEDCMYGKSVNKSKDCIDNLNTFKCELAYQCVDCSYSYDIQFSNKLRNCNHMRYCLDCQNCANCFACCGLRNKKTEFYILNKKVSQAEFESLSNDPQKQNVVLKKLSELHKTVPKKFTEFINCENFSGGYLENSKNTHYCWDCENMEDVKFCDSCQNIKNSYDISYYGATQINELLYEGEGVGHGLFQVLFSKLTWGGCSNVLYSFECFKCNHCFGCAELKNKEYCILNKQYSKEKYEKLVPKIIEHMQKTKEWGEFFPVEISPFGYNETVAQEYFPLNKEEATKRGWKWKDEENQLGYQGPRIEISKSIQDVSDSICDQVLTCEVTGKNYKITPPELTFYRKHNLPIPKKHPDQRHKERLTLRNPRKLWKRNCTKCGKEIQTTYAPERPETVYCEKCYLKDVY